MSGNDTGGEVLTLVGELDREREQLVRSVSAAQQALESLSHRIARLQEALGVHREHQMPTQSVTEIDPKLRERFGRLCTKEMLVQIAEEGGGMLDGANACRTLVRAGMFRDYRNASNTVYSTLSRHGSLFQRVGKGRYRLVEARRECGGATKEEDEPSSVRDTPFELARAG